MTVTVRLFAILRERAGSDSVEIELPEGATVGDAFACLADAPGLAELVGRLPLRMAVNREYAGEETAIRAGDELALIPPISGGAAARTRAFVTEEPLDAGELSASVGDAGAGAIVTFQGVTREVASLDYEAYREMAEERIATILAECAERHGLLAAAAAHRVGEVARGEPGVVVAVSAGHREEAFAGAREAIGRIKAEAPIWKRELDAAGAGTWVPGEPAPHQEPAR
ncbi:MAG TPA: molybdenum cofactor biosynthesis protein MoaE [Solirubrobacterales bacterium]|nr:molybdenum cofactor biosynthesis protein MoaE [Solirubrobacterales bacterium]